MGLKETVGGLFAPDNKQQEYDGLIAGIIKLRTAEIKLTQQERDDLERELSDQLYKNNGGRLIYALAEARALHGSENQKNSLRAESLTKHF